MALLPLPPQTERKYLSGWLEMGFGEDAVAEAYDRTVVSAGALKWPYLNKILVSWDQQGLHTLEEILAGDPRGGRKHASPAQEGTAGDWNDLDRAKALLQRRKAGKE